MKAHEHYQESVLYAEKAAEEEDFAAALVGSVLALAHAVQAAVMLKAMDEIQYPKERGEWRDQWRSGPPQKCE